MVGLLNADGGGGIPKIFVTHNFDFAEILLLTSSDYITRTLANYACSY